MKVCISLDNNDIVRSGYINIDPLANPNDPQRIKANIDQLDLYVDDAELTELIAVDVIDYVPAAEKGRIIEDWLKKIGREGTITIGGTDGAQVSKALAFGQITIEQWNDLVYGNKLVKSAIITANHMAKLLNNYGYKILEKKMVDFSYLVKAERVN